LQGQLLLFLELAVGVEGGGGASASHLLLIAVVRRGRRPTGQPGTVGADVRGAQRARAGGGTGRTLPWTSGLAAEDGQPRRRRRTAAVRHQAVFVAVRLAHDKSLSVIRLVISFGLLGPVVNIIAGWLAIHGICCVGRRVSLLLGSD